MSSNPEFDFEERKRSPSQKSRHSHSSMESSSSSSSGEECKLPRSTRPRQPTYHSGGSSSPSSRGRTIYSGVDHPSRTMSASSNSSSDAQRRSPYSARDISDLDGLIARHLDRMARKLRHQDYHADCLEAFRKTKKDLQWQIFLARTGLCTARPAADARGVQLPTTPESLALYWQLANENQHRAEERVRRYECEMGECVAVLCKLLKEKDRRRRRAVKAKKEEL